MLVDLGQRGGLEPVQPIPGYTPLHTWASDGLGSLDVITGSNSCMLLVPILRGSRVPWRSGIGFEDGVNWSACMQH